MMAVSQAPRNGDWALQVALIASLLVHALVVLLGMISYDAVVRALDPSHATGPAAQNEIVQIASVVSIDHRAPAPPVSAPRSSNATNGQPRHVTTLAHFGFTPSSVATPQAQSAVQLAFAAALAKHKLSIDSAHEQEHNPATVPQKMQLAMEGLRKKLTRGQGIYFPTRGWTADGEDFYDASYEFIYPDGTDEKGVVPWPIHFDPSADPFFSADPEALSRTPLPGPPPGFTPPGDLGKALRAYFPSLHFEDSDG